MTFILWTPQIRNIANLNLKGVMQGACGGWCFID